MFFGTHNYTDIISPVELTLRPIQGVNSYINNLSHYRRTLSFQVGFSVRLQDWFKYFLRQYCFSITSDNRMVDAVFSKILIK